MRVSEELAQVVRNYLNIGFREEKQKIDDKYSKLLDDKKKEPADPAITKLLDRKKQLEGNINNIRKEISSIVESLRKLGVDEYGTRSFPDITTKHGKELHALEIYWKDYANGVLVRLLAAQTQAQVSNILKAIGIDPDNLEPLKR